MKIVCKHFDELTISELYELLQLRSEVFVVEQDCVYQDLDGKDDIAIHVLGKKEGRIVAYCRIFKAGAYFENPSIGRVVVNGENRKDGFGKDIMMAGIAYVENDLHTKIIEISAQTYLTKFYTSLGFQVVGEPYLEDGIPHIHMLRK